MHTTPHLICILFYYGGAWSGSSPSSIFLLMWGLVSPHLTSVSFHFFSLENTGWPQWRLPFFIFFILCGLAATTPSLLLLIQLRVGRNSAFPSPFNPICGSAATAPSLLLLIHLRVDRNSAFPSFSYGLAETAPSLLLLIHFWTNNKNINMNKKRHKIANLP